MEDPACEFFLWSPFSPRLPRLGVDLDMEELKNVPCFRLFCGRSPDFRETWLSGLLHEGCVYNYGVEIKIRVRTQIILRVSL